MAPPVAMSRRYTQEQITDGLMALALYNGSAAGAARELKRQGRPIPKRTLHGWKDTHRNRYLEVRDQVKSQVWGKMSDTWRKTAEAGAEATLEAIERGREAPDSKEANSWASAARNYATAGGISNDKARVIDDQPTEIRRTDDRDLSEILRELQRAAPGAVKIAPELLESTAEELPADSSP